LFRLRDGKLRLSSRCVRITGIALPLSNTRKGAGVGDGTLPEGTTESAEGCNPMSGSDLK